MDQWLSFVQDKWILLLIAVVAIVVIISIVKTVAKWVIALIIVAAVIIYGANYTDSIKTIGSDIGNKVMNDLKEQAFKAFVSDVKEAKYEANKDGSFTVTTKSVKLEGKAGDPQVKVTILGQTFSMDADSAVQAFIDQAKNNAK
jgi:hypothetical protein